MTEPKPYIPFLKLKQNEIMALKELDGGIKAGLTPFFDFPNDLKGNTSENFIIKTEAERKRIQKHLWKDIQFYIDTFDVNDLDINGQHNYEYLLDAFQDFSIIPVIGVDRTPEHKQAIIDHMATQGDGSGTIGFRIVTEDFQSYTAIQDDISSLFEGLLDLFATIDLIFDNRLCLGVDVETTASHIAQFSQRFNQDYPVRKIIITGSSIPASLSEICPAGEHRTIIRKELLIHRKAKQEHQLNAVFGDYTTVSPLFSEPNDMAKMNGASKVIYADGQEQYIRRGRSVRVYGGGQFNEHINELTQKSYYHQPHHSWADKRFYDTRLDSSGYSTSSIVKHLINAHISYMAKTHNY
jgi:hypothetical protein